MNKTSNNPKTAYTISSSPRFFYVLVQRIAHGKKFGAIVPDLFRLLLVPDTNHPRKVGSSSKGMASVYTRRD